MSDIAIKVEGVGKKYSIGKQKEDTLRATIARLFSNSNKGGDDFWALKGISFEVKKGDVIGIIGKNGAGKSTLLKILSQITSPTTGRIEINGRVASLLEVGTGFHPELTGRENIFLNGTILGMSRREVKSKFDEIVDFSGIERFIDTPVKHYSSGMYVRLAFAVAAHLEPEMLIIDEVLAVGDADFQKKCLGKMKDVSSRGRTVLFVSHNMETISDLTSKAILLQNGEISRSGKSEDVIIEYYRSQIDETYIYISDKGREQPHISKVQVATSSRKNIHSFGKELAVGITVEIPRPLRGAAISFQIVDSKRRPVLHPWIFDSEEAILREEGVHKLTCVFPRCRLYKGDYTLSVYLSEVGMSESIEILEGICPFSVRMLEFQRKDYPWKPFTCAYIEDFRWSLN